MTPTGVGSRASASSTCILARTQEFGYGENIDETALGLHCIAVPVGPSGRVAAALTLCVPSGRMSSERAAMLRPVQRGAVTAPLADAPPPTTRKIF